MRKYVHFSWAGQGTRGGKVCLVGLVYLVYLVRLANQRNQTDQRDKTDQRDTRATSYESRGLLISSNSSILLDKVHRLP